MRRLALTGLALALGAGTLDAQTLRFGAQGALMSYAERNEAYEYGGAGFAGFAGIRIGPVAVDASGIMATLDPETTGLETGVKATQIDVTAAYFIAPAVALQVGAATRRFDPEFALQDAGYIKIGARSENALSRIASVWLRGAYLAAPKFNGGGSAGFSFEVGLGTSIGAPNGRFAVRAEYDFQRIDRQVTENDPAPIQSMVARLGVQIGI